MSDTVSEHILPNDPPGTGRSPSPPEPVQRSTEDLAKIAMMQAQLGGKVPAPMLSFLLSKSSLQTDADGMPQIRWLDDRGQTMLHPETFDPISTPEYISALTGGRSGNPPPPPSMSGVAAPASPAPRSPLQWSPSEVINYVQSQGGGKAGHAAFQRLCQDHMRDQEFRFRGGR